MNLLGLMVDKHPGCMAAAWLGIVPVSSVVFFGVPLLFGSPVPNLVWLFFTWALTWFLLTIVRIRTAPAYVKQLAAELCEAGTWKASWSGFSGRVGTSIIVNNWSQVQQGNDPLNLLLLQCPPPFGFLIERTSADNPVEWALRQTVNVTQFDLFEQIPYERGDEHALQTDDPGRLLDLMKDARFASALAALEKGPGFRCLGCLEVPSRATLFLKGGFLSPLAGREGIVLIRMASGLREAAAIRQDLALLGEIRDAMAAFP